MCRRLFGWTLIQLNVCHTQLSVIRTLHWAEGLTVFSLLFYSLTLQWWWKTGISDLKMLLSTLQLCKIHSDCSFDCNQRWLCLPWNMDIFTAQMKLWYKTENIHVYMYLLNTGLIVSKKKTDSSSHWTVCGNSVSGCIFPFTGNKSVFKHPYL